MRKLTLLTLLLAAVALVAAPAAATAGQAQPAVVTAETTAECAGSAELGELSPAELTAWAGEKGLTLTAASATAEDLPLCPRRVSCDPCHQGTGPCFLKEFGSDACCVSPTGPCILCPKGTTILVTSCPCFGLAASCPTRDQDWFCG